MRQQGGAIRIVAESAGLFLNEYGRRIQARLDIAPGLIAGRLQFFVFGFCFLFQLLQLRHTIIHCLPGVFSQRGCFGFRPLLQFIYFLIKLIDTGIDLLHILFFLLLRVGPGCFNRLFGFLL